MTLRPRICLPLAAVLLATAADLSAQGGSAIPPPELRATVAPSSSAGEVDSAISAEASAVVLAPEDAWAVFGLSGALRAALVPSAAPLDPLLAMVAGAGEGGGEWVPLYGSVRRGLPGVPVGGGVIAPDGPGVWRLDSAGSYVAADGSMTLVTTVPFAEKRGEHLNGYHIGIYPTERSPRADSYAPPREFIEVTAENQDLHVSQHLRLRQFLTKDQFDVWPKYLALNMRLVDKLELVLQELNLMGVRALELHVMSGFRTPQYNGPGGDGRATLSRHMYGDAADIWVDGDRDGYIDDLNGDGRHDIRDAALLLRAVERVEQKYPELTGGAGLYESNDHHGPYVHVDVRGSRARW